MARKQKYYGTYIKIWGDIGNNLKKYHPNYNCKDYRIVCKASSMTEANKIANQYGIGKNVFKRDYTSETYNDKELELCDKYGFIIRVDDIDNYVNIEDVL